uniref:C-type lectin domain family 4 member M-like n=1 Tax=Styela clava TaxID=7725 RepID=UPI00193A2789|nr:C-type lectin domain family 4 member M-like [Styela clava]
MWQQNPSFQLPVELGLEEMILLQKVGLVRWTNGKSVNNGYNKWEPGAPSNSWGTEDCAESTGFYWNDRTCTDSNSFICQIGYFISILLHRL